MRLAPTMLSYELSFSTISQCTKNLCPSDSSIAKGKVYPLSRISGTPSSVYRPLVSRSLSFDLMYQSPTTSMIKKPFIQHLEKILHFLDGASVGNIETKEFSL